MARRETSLAEPARVTRDNPAVEFNLDMAEWGWRTVLDWQEHKKTEVDLERVRWYYDCYDGDYWPDQDDTDEVRAYVNHVFAQTQTRKAVSTARRPTLVFLPEEGKSPSEVARNQILWDRDWRTSDFDHLRSEIVGDGYIAGTGVAKVLSEGKKIQFDVVNMLQFVTSPGSTFLQRCFGCAHVQEMHIYDARELAKRWGRVDPRTVLPERIGSVEELTKVRESRSGEVAKDVLNSKSVAYVATVGRGSDVGASDMVTVLELYYKGKGGRIQLLVLAGMAVLYHGVAPIPDYFPFAVYQPFPSSTRFWGTPFPQVYESGTDWTSKLLSITLEGLITASTPFIFAPRELDIDFKGLESGRGIQAVLYNASASAQAPILPQQFRVPGEAFAALGQLSQFIEVVTGRTEAVRGVNPGGVTSGEQFSQILEAASTFLQPEINSLEYGDLQIARIWASAKGVKNFEDMIVEPGSSTGLRKIQLAQLVMQLAQAGFLGSGPVARREVLRRLDYPDYEAYLEKVEESEAGAAAQMSSLAAAASPPQEGAAVTKIRPPGAPAGFAA